VFLCNALKQFDIIIDVAENIYATQREKEDDQKETREK
jgi:hypothetical protein